MTPEQFLTITQDMKCGTLILLTELKPNRDPVERLAYVIAVDHERYSIACVNANDFLANYPLDQALAIVIAQIEELLQKSPKDANNPEVTKILGRVLNNLLGERLRPDLSSTWLPCYWIDIEILEQVGNRYTEPKILKRLQSQYITNLPRA